MAWKSFSAAGFGVLPDETFAQVRDLGLESLDLGRAWVGLLSDFLGRGRKVPGGCERCGPGEGLEA